jgi:hypothetical protein
VTVFNGWGEKEKQYMKRYLTFPEGRGLCSGFLVTCTITKEGDPLEMISRPLCSWWLGEEELLLIRHLQASSGSPTHGDSPFTSPSTVK